MELAVFCVFALVALVSAVLVVTSRSVVYSALFLVLAFLGVAGLFILQGAEFVAAVQILLYAGSIVVMFVFVVMMVNLQERLGPQWASFRGGFGVLLGVVVLLELIWIALGSRDGLSVPNQGLTPGAGHVQVLGKVLFQEFLLPFEILSLVLLAALFGLIVIGKRK